MIILNSDECENRVKYIKEHMSQYEIDEYNMYYNTLKNRLYGNSYSTKTNGQYYSYLKQIHNIVIGICEDGTHSNYCLSTSTYRGRKRRTVRLFANATLEFAICFCVYRTDFIRKLSKRYFEIDDRWFETYKGYNYNDSNFDVNYYVDVNNGNKIVTIKEGEFIYRYMLIQYRDPAIVHASILNLNYDILYETYIQERI